MKTLIIIIRASCFVWALMFQMTEILGSSVDSLYTIKSIQKKENGIIKLTAKRNDSTFVIISLSDSINESSTKLVVGGKYDLCLLTIPNILTEATFHSMTHIISPRSIMKEYFEACYLRIKLTKKTHYSLYLARNMIGLSITPQMYSSAEKSRQIGAIPIKFARNVTTEVLIYRPTKDWANIIKNW